MTKNKRILLVIILNTIIIFGFATFCMAAGTGTLPLEQPDGKLPTFGNLYTIGWTAVNFFVLLALIYKFGYGPVNSILEQRSAAIEGSLKHAEEIKSEVEQIRQEAQANRVEARQEAQEIVSRFTKAAEEAKDEIISKAKEEADIIKIKAEADIKAATEAAKAELRDTAASLAIMAAEKVLARAITEDDHKQMVKQFVNEAGDLLC